MFFENYEGRYNILVNKHCNRWCTFTDNRIQYSWGLNLTRQILTISALDFTLNGASLGLRLTLKNDTGFLFKFGV